MAWKYLLALAVLAAPLPAATQEPPSCTAMNTNLPPALSGWLARDTLVAAAKPGELKKATLKVGVGVSGVLKLTPDIIYPVLPEKPGGSVSYGGLFSLAVDKAGTYQISLGSGAWIDLIDSRKQALTSSAHAPGPACSTLRKTVQFQLKPGRYTIQASGNGDRILPIMVTRVDG